VSSFAATRSVDTAGLRRLMLEGAAELRVAVSAREADALMEYVALLERWNGTYNLTAMRDRQAMITHHVLDCLAVLPPLRRELTRIGGTRVLDVGSGAGLPGVIVAVMAADLEVVCVESVGKKSAFIQQASAALRLTRCRSIHARVESLEIPSFDVITSRAFASLASFVRSTAHLLKPNGTWLAMKGKVPAEELVGLDPSITFHVEPLTVPGIAAERCLIWMQGRN